jgi:hypothetical protein
LAAFRRTNKTRTAITAAPIEEATTGFISFHSLTVYLLSHYISNAFRRKKKTTSKIIIFSYWKKEKPFLEMVF